MPRYVARKRTRSYSIRAPAAKRRRVSAFRIPRFRMRRTFRTRGSRPPVIALKRHSDQAFRIAYNNGGTITAPNSTLAAIGVVAGAEVNMHLFSFRLEDVPNDSEFTSLFRYYKLNGVRMTFSMRGSTVFAQGNSQGLPVMSWMFAPLMDETNMPVTLQQFREYSSYKKFYFGNRDRRMKSVFIKPRILNRMTDMNGTNINSIGRT